MLINLPIYVDQKTTKWHFTILLSSCHLFYPFHFLVPV